MTAAQIPTEGRIVHVRTPGIPHCQPAIVVRNWSSLEEGAINVAIFRDGSNDLELTAFAPGTRTEMVAWATSVGYRDPEATEPDAYQRRTWHWPERV